MSREKPQVDSLSQHPAEYQQDLNPNAMKGQNISVGETQEAQNGRTAFDHKQAHDRLRNMTDDNLKQIRIMDVGARLHQGATYLDLNLLDAGEFTATGDMEAPPGTLYVAKKDVPYHLWNLLLGVDNSARLADASDRGAVESSESDAESSR